MALVPDLNKTQTLQSKINTLNTKLAGLKVQVDALQNGNAAEKVSHAYKSADVCIRYEKGLRLLETLNKLLALSKIMEDSEYSDIDSMIESI